MKLSDRFPGLCFFTIQIQTSKIDESECWLKRHKKVCVCVFYYVLDNKQQY